MCSPWGPFKINIRNLMTQGPWKEKYIAGRIYTPALCLSSLVKRLELESVDVELLLCSSLEGRNFKPQNK